MNSRERVIAMLEGRPVDHLPLMPITMMFAADRIGQPYGKYATDYRIMGEAQLRTAEEFDLDYVSTISDPAREAADFGAQVRYFPDQPPAIDEDNALLLDKSALARLKRPDPLGGGRMHDRIKGVEYLRQHVAGDKAVEGWVEGPCAEASDIRGINNLMLDFFDDPQFICDLFERLVENALAFARPQVQAGADYIGVGDAAASLVGPDIYREFIWPMEKKLVDGLHALGTRVRLHICGNTQPLLKELGELGCEMIDIDYLADFAEARKQTGPRQVLSGNIDPVRILRNGTPASITDAIATCHQQAGERYIVAAGCEVPRDTAPANLYALRDYAQSH